MENLQCAVAANPAFGGTKRHRILNPSSTARQRTLSFVVLVALTVVDLPLHARPISSNEASTAARNFLVTRYPTADLDSARTKTR